MALITIKMRLKLVSDDVRRFLDSFSATFIKALRWYLLGLLCIGSHRRKAVGIVSALHSYDCSVDMINHLLD